MATDDIVADIDSDPDEVDEREATIRRLDASIHNVNLLKASLVEASENGDPETLSRGLVKLAEENSNLGVIAAKLVYLAKLANQAYDAERHKRKLKYIENKYAIAKAETQAKVDTEELLDVATNVQVMADEADNLSYRIDSLLKMGQSRLSLIKGDAVRG